MPFFDDPDEVYAYIGGAFKAVLADAAIGSALAATGLVLALELTDPSTAITVVLGDRPEVLHGLGDRPADLHLKLAADHADRFWRGDYNLGIGMARGHVSCIGDVTQLLGLTRMLTPYFPWYRHALEVKDRRHRGRPLRLPVG